MKRISVAATLLFAGCPGEFDPDLVGSQPDEGLYSACERGSDCEPGACLGSSDIEVEFGPEWEGQGTCTRFADDGDPQIDCQPFPEGYATAELAYGMDDQGQRFCVLECVGDLKCPVGMACIRVYSPVSMYESEICL